MGTSLATWIVGKSLADLLFGDRQGTSNVPSILGDLKYVMNGGQSGCCRARFPSPQEIHIIHASADKEGDCDGSIAPYWVILDSDTSSSPDLSSATLFLKKIVCHPYTTIVRCHLVVNRFV